MDKIQLGFDIATSISIMGASISYIVGQKHEGRKNREEIKKHERIKQMSKIISDFSKILNKGAKKAKLIAQKKMKIIREAVGLNY